MIDSLSWFGWAAVLVAVPAWIRPTLANALDLVLRGRTAVRLERERRVTLTDVLEGLRPGGCVIEHCETGYRRFVGQGLLGQGPLVDLRGSAGLVPGGAR